MTIAKPSAEPHRPQRADRPHAILTSVALILLAMLPTGFEAAGQSFYLDLAARILIFALAASALNIILGYGGMVCFGHAAFLGLGAYSVGILFVHHSDGTSLFGLPGTLSGLISFPLAMVVAGTIALLIGAVSLRTRGVQFIMITLAFAQMLFFLMISLGRYGGQDGIALWERSSLPLGFDLHDEATFYYLCLGVLLAFLVFKHRLLRARFGRVIRGAKDNDERLQALGFATYRYRLAAFVLSGAVTGLAGALLANATYFVGPSYLDWHRSGDLIVMVVLGGMGTLIGPSLGAAALLLMETFLPELLDSVYEGSGDYWKAVLGPLLLLTVLFARRGLAGLVMGRGR